MNSNQTFVKAVRFYQLIIFIDLFMPLSPGFNVQLLPALVYLKSHPNPPGMFEVTAIVLIHNSPGAVL